METRSAEYPCATGQVRATFPVLPTEYETVSAEALVSRNWKIDLRYGLHPRPTFCAVLKTAKLDSVRGEGGKLTKTVLKIFENDQDAYVTECSLK
ncbi:MAG TPA: hypothetical protein VFY81_02200 [Gammaproteobacteria bacterium]|nr:hypothetical protein [Gammaproteobacteria bacterium]